MLPPCDASISINISIRSLCVSEDSRDISTSISFLLMLMLMLMLMLASLVRTGLNQIAKYILSVHLSSQ